MKHALIALLLCIGLAGGSFLGGVRVANDRHAAQQAKQEREAAQAFRTEVQRGDRASADLQAELLQQTTSHEALERAFNAYRQSHPLLARRSAPAAAPSVASAGPAAAGEQPQPGRAADAPAGAADGAGPGLSLGAVWMWNSALAGSDTPAGACGLSDTSESACAADAGVTLEDAWANAAVNARLCAADRLRYQRLIDFINKGQTHAD